MAFSWSTTPSKGGKISANEVNEVRNLLNTMYTNLQCSARQAVVYSSRNEGYLSTKYESNQACSTVYGSRYSTYCAAVQGSFTTTARINNAIIATCPKDNSTQYTNNTCNQNDSSDRTSTYISDNSANEENDCPTNNWGEYYYDDRSNDEDYDFCASYDGSCSSHWDYHDSGECYTQQRRNCEVDDWSEYAYDNDAYHDYNHTNNWNTQHAGNYASKVTCSARQSTYYSGRQTGENSTVYSSKYLCQTQHSTYGS